MTMDLYAILHVGMMSSSDILVGCDIKIIAVDHQLNRIPKYQNCYGLIITWLVYISLLIFEDNGFMIKEV